MARILLDDDDAELTEMLSEYRELVGRLQAILHRTDPVAHALAMPDGEVVVVGDLQLDRRARVVRRGERLIELTSAEFELLRLLLASPGRVVSRDEMCRTVLGREHTSFDRSIDNHMSALRRKLGKGSRGLDRIRSVRNVGYAYTWLEG